MRPWLVVVRYVQRQSEHSLRAERQVDVEGEGADGRAAQQLLDRLPLDAAAHHVDVQVGVGGSMLRTERAAAVEAECGRRADCLRRRRPLRTGRAAGGEWEWRRARGDLGYGADELAGRCVCRRQRYG